MAKDDILDLPELPITRVEKIGVTLAFLALGCNFIFCALAAAGIVNMNAAQLMLFAAWIVVVGGAVVVERLSARSWRRILTSFFVTAIVATIVLYGLNVWMVRHMKVAQEKTANSSPTPTPVATLATPTTSATPSNIPTPTMTPTATPLSRAATTPSVMRTPPSAPKTPAVVKQETQRATLTNDTKIGLLQCSASEYDKDTGYHVLENAVCIAKHQQTGEEFIGTIGHEGVANINLPYGFYKVTIKAEGYLTRVEAVKVGEQFGSVVVVLQKAR